MFLSYLVLRFICIINFIPQNVFIVFRVFSYLLTYYLLIYLPTYSSLVVCHLSHLIFYFNSNSDSVYFTESPVRFSGCDTVHMHYFPYLFCLPYTIYSQYKWSLSVNTKKRIFYHERKLFKLQLRNLDIGLQVKENMVSTEMDY